MRCNAGNAECGRCRVAGARQLNAEEPVSTGTRLCLFGRLFGVFLGRRKRFGALEELWRSVRSAEFLGFRALSFCAWRGKLGKKDEGHARDSEEERGYQRDEYPCRSETSSSFLQAG